MRTIEGVRGRGVSEVAERQMRRWSHDMQVHKEQAEQNQTVGVPQFIQPFLVISREAGVDAAGVGINGGALAANNLSAADRIAHPIRQP